MVNDKKKKRQILLPLSALLAGGAYVGHRVINQSADEPDAVFSSAPAKVAERDAEVVLPHNEDIAAAGTAAAPGRKTVKTGSLEEPHKDVLPLSLLLDLSADDFRQVFLFPEHEAHPHLMKISDQFYDFSHCHNIRIRVHVPINEGAFVSNGIPKQRFDLEEFSLVSDHTRHPDMLAVAEDAIDSVQKLHAAGPYRDAESLTTRKRMFLDAAVALGQKQLKQQAGQSRAPENIIVAYGDQSLNRAIRDPENTLTEKGL